MSPTVRLLPAADPWVMGPSPANPHVVPLAHRQPVTRGANLVLATGVVAGTWTRTAGTLSGWITGERDYFGRPNDILQASDGSLLISDDWAGAIYRISYAK